MVANMILGGDRTMKKFDSASRSLILLLFMIVILMPGRLLSGQSNLSASPTQGVVLVTNNLDLDFSKYKVTFIELGADRCIPCKAMQPIMKEMAKEYAGKIQVVFYDVWKDPAPARKYGIQLIPTQVFVDQGGKEIFRHVGFYAKEEMLSMLKEKGIL
jgi:thioredoxin 1